jgi:ADP-ribose pyrophosphatase YjhB (NUDIX family)
MCGVKIKKFKPKPGQIDYTNIRYAPVINCVVRRGRKILIVKRNPKMKLYPGHWNGISGFLDDNRGIVEKVKEELKEELGIMPRNIINIRLGGIFEQEEPKYKKTWIVHPVLVKIGAVAVQLDWEADGYKWVDVKNAFGFKLLPGFDRVLKTFFSYKK